MDCDSTRKLVSQEKASRASGLRVDACKTFLFALCSVERIKNKYRKTVKQLLIAHRAKAETGQLISPGFSLAGAGKPAGTAPPAAAAAAPMQSAVVRSPPQIHANREAVLKQSQVPQVLCTSGSRSCLDASIGVHYSGGHPSQPATGSRPTLGASAQFPTRRATTAIVLNLASTSLAGTAAVPSSDLRTAASAVTRVPNGHTHKNWEMAPIMQPSVPPLYRQYSTARSSQALGRQSSSIRAADPPSPAAAAATLHQGCCTPDTRAALHPTIHGHGQHELGARGESWLFSTGKLHSTCRAPGTSHVPAENHTVPRTKLPEHCGIRF